MNAKSLSDFQETILFEWKITGLRNLLDSTAVGGKSKSVRSLPFGEDRWRLSFYANSGLQEDKEGYVCLYLVCEPTSEEMVDVSLGRWFREGVHYVCFEMLNTSRTISYGSLERGNQSFSWERPGWGRSRFACRNKIYQGIRSDRSRSDAAVIVCTIISSREVPSHVIPTVSLYKSPLVECSQELFTQGSSGTKEVIEVEKEYVDAEVQTQLGSPLKANCSPIPSLLTILRQIKAGSLLTRAANAEMIDLVHLLLTPSNYVNIALESIINESDAELLLNILLYLLCSGSLPCSDIPDANRRARRLMLKMITKTAVTPSSLFVKGIKAKVDYDFIGQGGFGFVFKGELGGISVAMKLLYKTRHNNDFCREALTWRSLNHKCVLPFLGIYEDEGSRMFLVSPYMTNGTLSQWRKNVVPSTSEIQRLMLETAEGMHYIHSEGIVHGDLRGDNILLDTDFHVQIADFGLTRHVEATATQSGALHYNFAAPELFGIGDPDDEDVQSDSDDEGQLMQRTQKSDVYAFGCLYYEIQFDTIPFRGTHELQIARLVCQGKRPPRMDEPSLSDKAWRLIKRCWMREAVRRPTMESILEKMVAWKSV